MSEFVNTIDLLGDEAVTKALVEKTITEFNDDVITKVGSYAFYDCTAFKSADFPNAKSIGQYSFNGCTSLTSVNAPLALSVGSRAFENCTDLTSVNFPNLMTTNLKIFVGCTQLKSVDLPKVTGIDQNLFQGCSSLTSVNTPLAVSVGSYAFENCTALTSLDFPLVTSIDRFSAFSKCSSLSALILRSSTLCTLSGASSFSNTPFASGKAGGTLLVPRSLVTEYPNATNWSSTISGNANNRVLALEDYTIDGTITGEIDWDKLNGGTT